MRKNINPKFVEQLAAHGLIINDDDNIVKAPSPVREAVRSGANNGVCAAKAVPGAIVSGATTIEFAVVDMPVLGIKALGRKVRSGHAKRVEQHNARIAARAAKREAANNDNAVATA